MPFQDTYRFLTTLSFYVTFFDPHFSISEATFLKLRASSYVTVTSCYCSLLINSHVLARILMLVKLILEKMYLENCTITTAIRPKTLFNNHDASTNDLMMVTDPVSCCWWSESSSDRIKDSNLGAVAELQQNVLVLWSCLKFQALLCNPSPSLTLDTLLKHPHT